MLDKLIYGGEVINAQVIFKEVAALVLVVDAQVGGVCVAFFRIFIRPFGTARICLENYLELVWESFAVAQG